MTIKRRRGRNFGLSWLSLFPLTRCSHYPLNTCARSPQFSETWFQTALSIFKESSTLTAKENNWKLWQAHTHAMWYKLWKVTIVPNLKQVTCNTALSNTTACKAKVTASSISLFFNVWVGNSWMAFVRWNPWTENRCERFSTTYQRQRLSHTAFWRSLAHKSFHLSRPTGWQASWAIPICHPAPSRGLGLSCLAPATKTPP